MSRASETSFTSINERRYRYVNSWMYALSTFRVLYKKELGEDVTIISSAEETAIELSTILQHKGILSDNLNPKHRFLQRDLFYHLNILLSDG